MKHILLAASAVPLILLSAPAGAQDMSMAEIQAQLKMLSSQVQALSEVVEAQNDVIKRQEAQLAAQDSASLDQIDAVIDQRIESRVEAIQSAAHDSAPDRAIKITKDPSPKFETADGKFSFQPFGRVHLDATVFDNDKSDNVNNSNIRRARLGFKGKIGEDLEYVSEMDFSEDEADIQDMTLTYTGLEHANITAGHHRPPIGFSRNTSTNHGMFIERAEATDLFAANRKIGLSAASKAEHFMIGAGVFNEGAGGSFDSQGNSLSLDTRVSANLLGLRDTDTDNVLHVGMGYSHQKPSSDVRYSARPAVSAGERFIDTGLMSGIDTINIINTELVGVFGPLSFQGEYFLTDVGRKTGNDASFDGFYGQASYFLTGESRNYLGEEGVFKRTKILNNFSLTEGGLGAFEAVARYSHTDLNDSGAGISGGALDMYSLGLNWYLNKNVRLMNNVVFVDTDDNAATAPDDDPTIFKMRAQWDF